MVSGILSYSLIYVSWCLGGEWVWEIESWTARAISKEDFRFLNNSALRDEMPNVNSRIAV